MTEWFNLEKLRFQDKETLKTAKRMIARTARRPSGCIEFTGGRDNDGYGFVFYNSKQVRVHRFVYFAWVGDIGPFWVLHRCDNPSCCNPEHLFLGTALDNKADCIAKKRSRGPRGESNGQHLLSEADVLEIRKRYKPYDRSGNNMYSLAREYRVSATCIHEIIHRQKWKHL